ncbi:MAG TPA: hypothetical protein VE713_06030 [Pyrinomonadaceae bacterium]|nr:hypothetical protein [Pyrinomonadaceae bacterium]
MKKFLRLFLAACPLVAALTDTAPLRAQSAPKTHVVDVEHDASGNPLTGKITFILTQKSASTPDGLVVASPSVSAVLDSAGKFDVWLYPSSSMSPINYYQVYVTAGAGSQTFLGVYSIPSSASVVTLAPYRVTDAALAAQYTFADAASVLALTQTVSQATLASLTFQNVVAALGYTPAPAVNPALSGGTATGLTCVGCTNITPGAGNGGVANTGDTVVAAGTGGGPGRISLQTHTGRERVGIEDDGTVTIPGLVISNPVPAQWEVTKYAGNPLTPASGTGDLQYENYAPGAVRVGADTWVYTKGNTQIYACKMVGGAPPCVPQGAVLSPGAAGSWDAANVINPYAVYDKANSLIHIYYSGRNASGVEQAGHATCPNSTPAVCTKDAANPVITAAQAQAALGLTTVNMVNVSAVARVGGMLTFYGWATDYNINVQPGTAWKLFRATGTTFSNPSIAGALTGFPTNVSRLTVVNDVFRLPGQSEYLAVFRDSGYQIDNTPATWAGTFLATSPDGLAWKRAQPLGSFIQPTAAASGFDVRGVHSARLLKDPDDPDFLRPLRDSGGYHEWFYSGIDDTGTKTQGGLAYVRPGAGGSTEMLRFDGTPASRPVIEIDNPAGKLGSARVYGYGDTLGTDMILSSGLGRDQTGTSKQTDPSLGSASVNISGRNNAVTIAAAPAGSGANLPVGLQVAPGGAALGVVVPGEPWGANYTRFHFGRDQSIAGGVASSNTNALLINQNAYFDGALWKYISSFSNAPASNVFLTGGTVGFRVADSGAAGATITWNTPLTLVKNGQQLLPVLFANVPTSPVDGTCAWVTDSTTATFNAVVTGGGSNHILACYDGSNWRVH